MSCKSFVSKLKIFSVLIPSLFIASCGGDNSINKGYEECKKYLKSLAENYGYSADSIRFLYCNYVYFDDQSLAVEYPVYGYGIVYCVYSQGNFTGKLKDYRDVFLYDRTSNYLKYYDTDDDYSIYTDAYNLVTIKSVKGKTGKIQE